MQNYSGDLFRVVIITAGPQCSEKWWQVPAVVIPRLIPWLESSSMRCLQELNSKEQLTQEMMKYQPIKQVFLQTFNHYVLLFQSSVNPLSQELQGKAKQLYSCCLDSAALTAVFCFTSLFSPLPQILVCFQSPLPLCFWVVF